jgi:hypothetical protein
LHQDILNADYDEKDILSKIKIAFDLNFPPVSLYGEGKSDLLFKEAISSQSFWNISKQKQFKDL